MKTTIEIPEETLSRAEKLAGEQGISLDDLIKNAVEKCLPPPNHTNEFQNSNKPWMKGFGALSHLSEETAKINQIIEEEFEQIEPWDQD